MRKSVLSALSLAAIAVPAPLLAQDADLPVPEFEEEAAADLAEKFSDPEYQRQTAMLMRTLSEVLLDLPLGPLMEAAGEMAGKEVPVVDHDSTLRSMAPEADRIPEEIERNLPRAMEAMGTMAEALEDMRPALEEMAARLQDSLPQE